MEKFKCDKCKKVFTRKYNLDRHFASSLNCSAGKRKQVESTGYSCELCGKEFIRRDSLNKHLALGRCNKAAINVETKGNNNVIKIENNSNSNNVYNINLIVFSKDGIENISPKDLCEILNSNKSLIESIVSNVNLNPDKPQHHNVFYGDMKSSYGEVYENRQWIKKKIDEILDTLVDAKVDDLNEILNDMNDFLNRKTQNKIKDAIENADYRRPGARKKLKSYLKSILYNNKDMIIKTRKLTQLEVKDLLLKDHVQAEEDSKLEKKVRTRKRKVAYESDSE